MRNKGAETSIAWVPEVAEVSQNTKYAGEAQFITLFIKVAQGDQSFANTIIARLLSLFGIFYPVRSTSQRRDNNSNHGYTIIARIFFRAIMVIQLLRKFIIPYLLN